jgi:hypothetical protein
VNLSAVERLHRNQIYPIVLLLKFKSAKQIKEIKDSRYGTAAMVNLIINYFLLHIIFYFTLQQFSTKQAKEMYEHALKLESEYRQYISGKFFHENVLQSNYFNIPLSFSCYPRRKHHSHEYPNKNIRRRGTEKNPLGSQELLKFRAISIKISSSLKIL